MGTTNTATLADKMIRDQSIQQTRLGRFAMAEGLVVFAILDRLRSNIISPETFAKIRGLQWSDVLDDKLLGMSRPKPVSRGLDKTWAAKGHPHLWRVLGCQNPFLERLKFNGRDQENIEENLYRPKDWHEHSQPLG